jgi:hydroxypyruvate reductase
MHVSESNSRLRDDALAIWQAGLEAVRSDRLVREHLRVEGDRLLVGDEALPLVRIRRIAVVGAGKAGAGMAAGLEEALGPRVLSEKQVAGWVNVPADCVRPLARIHLHAARPAGVNEPTEEGVRGAEKILEIVGALGPDDLCLCLLSGGGSALLPAPVPGIALGDKLAVTQRLSAAGANIAELNTVRKHLSRIKGGGLVRACRAGRLITLIISDVLGDPLDVIASGPTLPDTSTAGEALAILERYGGAPPAVLAHLRSHHACGARREHRPPVAASHEPCTPAVINLVIGNNARAVDAASQEAVRRDYAPALSAGTTLEGPAEEVGVRLARMAMHMASESGPDCLITGGEPTVRLAPPAVRGKGGRNQQVVLASLIELCNWESEIRTPAFCLLSAGTDGEDGPTDAAGAFCDGDMLAQLNRRADLDPHDFLRRNDAYTFFQQLGGLIKTGPTHTNVCDLRVVLVDRRVRPD